MNEIDEWMSPFFGASVYDDPAVYAKSDPMHFVKNVKTPTLILVGDRDGEVPMEQSVEWWHALEAMKVPVKFVVYPNEGHVFVKACRLAGLLHSLAGMVRRMVRESGSEVTTC